MKIDTTKPRLSLVYRSFMEAVARGRMYGLTKYPDRENWRTTEKEQHLDAALRHLFAVADGEDIDPESGVPHLALAACNIMFEIEREYGRPFSTPIEPTPVHGLPPTTTTKEHGYKSVTEYQEMAVGMKKGER